MRLREEGDGCRGVLEVLLDDLMMLLDDTPGEAYVGGMESVGYILCQEGEDALCVGGGRLFRIFQ